MNREVQLATDLVEVKEELLLDMQTLAKALDDADLGASRKCFIRVVRSLTQYFNTDTALMRIRESKKVLKKRE